MTEWRSGYVQTYRVSCNITCFIVGRVAKFYKPYSINNFKLISDTLLHPLPIINLNSSLDAFKTNILNFIANWSTAVCLWLQSPCRYLSFKDQLLPGCISLMHCNNHIRLQAGNVWFLSSEFLSEGKTLAPPIFFKVNRLLCKTILCCFQLAKTFQSYLASTC